MNILGEYSNIYTENTLPGIELTFSRKAGKMSNSPLGGRGCAGMAELADVQDLGSCAARRVGSTPTTRTIMNELRFSNIFIEKRGLSYSESLVIYGFPIFVSEH